MSKNTLTKEIQREIARLNDTIDRKIVRGKSYRDEARRHKMLLSELQKLRTTEAVYESREPKKRSRQLMKSPVRRTLERGSPGRIFGWGLLSA